jgi:hypothetical protein
LAKLIDKASDKTSTLCNAHIKTTLHSRQHIFDVFLISCPNLSKNEQKYSDDRSFGIEMRFVWHKICQNCTANREPGHFSENYIVNEFKKKCIKNQFERQMRYILVK